MLSRILVVVGVLALGALVVPGTGEEVPVATLADGRAGKIHFESRTPAGYFALARREPARKAVVFGTLRLPAAGPVAAMVIAHGSGGVDARETAWAERLTGLGVATFVVDSFTPRGRPPPTRASCPPRPTSPTSWLRCGCWAATRASTPSASG